MKNAARRIWTNGLLLKENEGHQVPLLAHTLHYGVGAFEGIRAYESDEGRACVFRLQDHINRLFDSCKLVLLQPPVTRAQVIDGCLQVLSANKFSEAYLRPIIYLSDGGLGLLPESNPVQVVVTAWHWGAYLGDDGAKNGVRCKISSYCRHAPNASLTRAKISGQYVTSVLAKRDAANSGFDEAILLDPAGFIAEGSGENIFLVKHNHLVTPPLASGILPGITRDTIITLAHEAGLQVEERPVPRDELYLADEAFFTGTAAEITPIKDVDNRVIGDGAVGPVTSQLRERYFELVRAQDDTHPEWLTFA